MRTIRLTPAEMTALWKKRMGFDTPRTDCDIVRSDGPDIDALMLEEAGVWYRTALREMPLCSLPQTDISARLTAAASPEGAARFLLPDGVIRVGEVSCPKWEREAFIVTQTGDPEAAAQSNPFARAGLCRPVAIVAGRFLTVYPSPDDGDTLTVRAVMEQDETGDFTVTEEMMAHAPIIDINS